MQIMVLSVDIWCMELSPPPCIFFCLLQECLDKFGDSLQEMVNYHMVSGVLSQAAFCAEKFNGCS